MSGATFRRVSTVVASRRFPGRAASNLLCDAALDVARRLDDPSLPHADRRRRLLAFVLTNLTCDVPGFEGGPPDLLQIIRSRARAMAGLDAYEEMPSLAGIDYAKNAPPPAPYHDMEW